MAGSRVEGVPSSYVSAVGYVCHYGLNQHPRSHWLGISQSFTGQKKWGYQQGQLN